MRNHHPELRAGLAGSGRWTPDMRARFLERLAAGAGVRAAADACGLSRQSVYKLRRHDPVFACAWDAARTESRAALDRAVMCWMHEEPRLAAAGIVPLDTDNPITRVSTIGRVEKNDDTGNPGNPVSTTGRAAESGGSDNPINRASTA